MENAVTLIYLFDEETLGQLHQAWPQGMRAALCLDETGEGNVALFHKDEYWQAAARIADLLGRDDSDFVIVPTFGGYPTRPISFSEEQQMCGMIANIADLPERAELHLAQLKSGPEDQQSEDQPQEVQIVAETEAAEEIITEEAPVAIPASDPPIAPAPRVTSRLPEGFHCPSNPTEAEKPPLKARLTRVGQRMQLTIAGASLWQRRPKPVDASEFGVNVDTGEICVVPPGEFDWKPGATIQFPAFELGKPWPRARRRNSFGVHVRDEGGGMVISPGKAKAVVKARKKPSKLRSAFGPAFAMIVAFGMLKIGTSDEALEYMSGTAVPVAQTGMDGSG